jgi:hypothetical protein
MSARSPVITCERFSFVETWAVSRQRRRAAAVKSVSGVAGEEVAAEREEDAALPLVHCLDRVDGVEAVIARRFEIKLRAQPDPETLPSDVPRCPSCDRPARC